ncbi:IS1595 family transposase [Photobacterium lutimaris]|uniref:IS1595 family transposase n=1 Tax=Photobacterium lutimaris TaxID=388278 RepID=A0A2T3ITS4_9GAMM|nr:IS1595 family transposase [Photobacterium lutimaris]PSU31748.1 IS1595 family transposase [Photobacterium lutimaris]TDR72605.1 InsA-like protein [Photobacterium lutimaris]
MDSITFKTIQDSIKNLSYVQLKRLKHQADEQLAKDEVGQAVAEREETISACPHCQSESYLRWGVTNQGKQRYRCKDCRKTFSSLTGTALYRMRKPEKWMEYTNCLWLSNSLRNIANKLNINLKTAFEWRHRLLKSPCNHKATELLGIIEADEAFLPQSFKGSRQMPREPRKRGGGNTPKVPILLALDRGGSISHHVLERNTTDELGAALKPLLSPDSVLCTDGNLSYKTIVKELNINIDHKRLVALDNKRVIEGIYHIQTLNNFMMRWKSWMVRFKGVGTAYLEHYIAWFRFMEQKKATKTCCWIQEAFYKV